MLEVCGLTKRYNGIPAVRERQLHAQARRDPRVRRPQRRRQKHHRKDDHRPARTQRGPGPLSRPKHPRRPARAISPVSAMFPRSRTCIRTSPAANTCSSSGACAGCNEPFSKPRSTNSSVCSPSGTTATAPVSAYSKGMRQKILLSAALLHNPDLLILDEPLSGLDVTTALVLRELVEGLAARGRMILYSSHVLDVLEKVCSRVLILCKGQGGRARLHREPARVDARIFARGHLRPAHPRTEPPQRCRPHPGGDAGVNWLARTHGVQFELVRHFLRRMFDGEWSSSPGQWKPAAIGVVSLLPSGRPAAGPRRRGRSEIRIEIPPACHGLRPGGRPRRGDRR